MHRVSLAVHPWGPVDSVVIVHKDISTLARDIVCQPFRPLDPVMARISGMYPCIRLMAITRIMTKLSLMRDASLARYAYYTHSRKKICIIDTKM